MPDVGCNLAATFLVTFCHGPCKASEGRVRIHNVGCHALAVVLGSRGLHVLEEAVVPSWSYKDAKGWHDAVLDVECRVPGSSVACRVVPTWMNGTVDADAFMLGAQGNAGTAKRHTKLAVESGKLCWERR